MKIRQYTNGNKTCSYIFLDAHFFDKTIVFFGQKKEGWTESHQSSVSHIDKGLEMSRVVANLQVKLFWDRNIASNLSYAEVPQGFERNTRTPSKGIG